MNTKATGKKGGTEAKKGGIEGKNNKLKEQMSKQSRKKDNKY